MRLSDSDRELIVEELSKEGVSRISLFGSFASGDADSESDIDILVDFDDDVSLMDVARIERELSEKIGRDFDIVTIESLSPHIKERLGDMEVLSA